MELYLHPQHAFKVWCSVKKKAQGQLYLYFYLLTIQRKLAMSKPHTKKTLITFFDIKGIIHFEFIPELKTVNQAYYSFVEVLKLLREAKHKKWPNDSILHHDNAPANKALSVKQFVAQKSITKMEHPPYSTDFAPHDFWLLPKIKSAL
jgi:hypothetical protein